MALIILPFLISISVYKGLTAMVVLPAGILAPLPEVDQMRSNLTDSFDEFEEEFGEAFEG